VTCRFHPVLLPQGLSNTFGQPFFRFPQIFPANHFGFSLRGGAFVRFFSSPPQEFYDGLARSYC